MLETCGDAENQLAFELSQHEVFVEKEIMDPLYGIAEVGAHAARPAWQKSDCSRLVCSCVIVIHGFNVDRFGEVREVCV